MGNKPVQKINNSIANDKKTELNKQEYIRKYKNQDHNEIPKWISLSRNNKTDKTLANQEKNGEQKFTLEVARMKLKKQKK